MFAGIVEEAARVVNLERGQSACRLTVRSALDHSRTSIGDSISIGGVCLTVVSKEGDLLTFDLSQETQRRSTLIEAAPGDLVNLERSLVLGERVHGHLVFGHADTVVTLLAREPQGDGFKLSFSLPRQLRRFITPKGSVAVAGISLTVGEVQEDRFSVYIIPHTWSATTLVDMRPGAKANLEVDMLARYVAAQLEDAKSGSRVTLEFLREHGYAVSEK
jgi:riboflavin synthase